MHTCTLLASLVIGAASLVCWRLLRRTFLSSTLDNVPGPLSASLLTGNMRQLFDANGWDYHKALAAKYGGLIRVNTLLGGSQIYVSDPKALQHILVKDNTIYEDTAGFIASCKIIFGNGLLTMHGAQHYKQRKMLNPVFSTAHIRATLPVFYSVGHRLRTALKLAVSEGQQEINMYHWMARTALELIGQAGLGYSFDSLDIHEATHPYVAATRKLVPALAKILFFRHYVLQHVVKVCGPRTGRFIVGLLPWKTLHDIRDALDMMNQTSNKIYQSKKQALSNCGDDVVEEMNENKDLMSILMKENMKASEEERLPESEVLAQITTFILAGTDSTTSALSRILHLLAQYPDVQEKLREAIVAAQEKCGDSEDLSYNELDSLPYLEAVCQETLRLYPPVPLLARTTGQDVMLPTATPIKGVDGKEMNEIFLPKNTGIYVSLMNLNRNPDIWGPDSYEWKPERWLSPLPETVADAHIPGVYSNTMTFSAGRRSCIGFKFAQLEIKVIVSLLIESFRFVPSERGITWRLHSVVSPAVEGVEEGRSGLPLKLSLTRSP